MSKEMTPKEALEKLNNFIPREKHIDSERNKTINKCVDTLNQALDRLEQLEIADRNNQNLVKTNVDLVNKNLELQKENQEIEKLYLNENKHWCETIDSLRKENQDLKLTNQVYIEESTKLIEQYKRLEQENEKIRGYNKTYRKMIEAKNTLIFKYEQSIEKIEKVIAWLKNTFEITLDSKVRISDGTDCIQAFPIDLKTNEVIYDLLKEVLE